MSRKKIRMIIVLATVSLVGLLAVQFTWLQKAYSLEEKEFNLSVQVALNQVSRQLLADSGDAIAYKPVKQLSSSFFLAELNAPIKLEDLDTLLRREFARRNLLIDFEYGLINASDDTLMFGNYIPATFRTKKSKKEEDLLPVANVAERRNFAVIFPGKTTHIMSEMSLWLYSSAALMIVIVFFAYTIISILKEKRLSELKENFINNMTHELQTPITNIAIASELLRDAADLPVKKAQRYHQIIYQENERLRAQVERVLQMAALEKKELALHKTRINVHQVIETTMQSLQLRLQKRAGNIRFNLEASQFEIMADSLHVTNVVYSLLDNAEKYSPEAPDIEITTRNHENGILISVADKGQGIKKEVQRFIFDKFYRIPTGNLHNVKGFGLGLSYVKAITEAHQGYVQLNSQENKGSRFDLFFPFA